MADSVLSKLVGTDKETKKTLESIDTTLEKIYKQQKEQFKKENTEKKRASRQAKRKQADTLNRALGLEGKSKGEDKKKKEGLFGSLLKGLDLKKILAIAGLGAAVAAYFKSPGFRNLVNESVLKPMWGAIKVGLIGENGLFGKKNQERAWKWIKENPLKTLGVAAAGMAAIIGPKGVLGLALNGLGLAIKGISSALNALAPLLGKKGLLGLLGKVGGAGLLGKIALLIGAPIALAAGAGAAQRGIREGQGGRGAAGKAYADAQERMGQLQARTKNKRGRTVRKLTAEEQEEFDRLAALSAFIKDSADQRKKGKTDSRGRGGGYSAEEQAAHQARVDAYMAENGYQSGGMVVPGSGSGDKVPMLLPSGSFVLNRNAAGFQTGGIIPTMLEPGEQVYGPGQWGPMEQMMNSMIPRFQSGGVVQANHEQTGPGWSPGSDGQGRPAVFSKGGAEAFAQMMKDSGGQVKTSDINSSQRTVAKNNSVGGSPTSNHLVGNGVDVQSGSPSWTWMKANSNKYGWNWNDYLGPSGWHWDYTGKDGGNLTTSTGNQGPEGQIQTQNQNGFQGAMQSLQKMLQGAGKLGGFVSKVFGAMTEGFGAGLAKSGLGIDISGFTNLMGAGVTGLGNFLTLSSGGGMAPGGSTPSAPLTGNNAQKAKQMYKYIKEKGYSSAQAKGIVANIQRESGFRTDAVGDGGMSHGLFQWYADRSDRMKSAVPNWSTNWQGQIDYALKEHVGPQYRGATSSMSAKDAAYWWMNKWEIPADRERGGPNHMKMNGFIDSYGFQKGGVVNMKGGGSQTNSRFQQAQKEFAQQIGAAAAPIVVPVPMGGGGAGPQVTNTGNTTGKPPQLPDGPSSIQSAEYFYRLNMGSAF